MKTSVDVHPIQAEILRVLLFKPEASFSEVNSWNIPTNQFSFHLNTVLESKLVTKTPSGSYTLTIEGKEFANRFDTDTSKVERQAKIGVAVCCIKEENGQAFYLIQQRLKQPFFGHYGFVSGKVRWGETALETAAREVEEETGLQVHPVFLRVHHKLDFTPNHELLEDLFFFCFIAHNPTGTLIEEFEGGRNQWMTREQIAGLEHFFHAAQITLDALESGKTMPFLEKEHVVEGY